MAKPSVEPEPDDFAPGLYAVGEDGIPMPLPAGSYVLDDEGAIRNGLDWQIPLQNIQWNKLHEVLQSWGQRGSRERTVNLVGMYLLVALIIGLAGYLASKHIVEGQALVGFLGAALGYLLSRGKAGLLGGQ